MFKKIIAAAFMISLLGGNSMAMDMDHGSQNIAEDGKSSPQMNSEQTEQEGKFIHSAEVSGYTLNFYLIDMKEKMAQLKAKGGSQMAGMNMGPMKSHHLMLYIIDQTGKKIADGRVGYMLIDKDGMKQKTMTMAMSGGYGADVELQAGTYKVMTKALVSGNKIVNSFELRVHSKISSQR